MQIRVKRFVTIFFVLVALHCTATSVSAIAPRLSDTNNVSVLLVFSGTTAYCDAKVTGADGTTSITNGHLVLTDSKGNVVADWNNLSSNSDKFTVSKVASNLLKGETYTLTFSAKVNRNGGTENVSHYVSKKC